MSSSHTGVKSRMMRWMKHIINMDKMTNAHNILLEKSEKKSIAKSL
jgi:hypothetical protein